MIHRARGLEFPAAIVPALDDLPDPMERDEARDGNRPLHRVDAYVELARATYHLVVTRAKRSAFTDRVERSVGR